MSMGNGSQRFDYRIFARRVKNVIWIFAAPLQDCQVVLGKTLIPCLRKKRRFWRESAPFGQQNSVFGVPSDGHLSRMSAFQADFGTKSANWAC